VVARLSQLNLEIELKAATASMEEFKAELDRLTAAVSDQQEMRDATIDRQVTSANTRIKRAEERLAEAIQRLREEEDLLNRGISVNQRVIERETRVDQTHNELSNLRQSLADLEMRRFDDNVVGIQQIESAHRPFADAERQVSTIQARLTRESVIRAPSAGRVTEIQAAPGEVIAVGRPIVSFESIGEGLELVLYLPPQYGKSVKPDMNVQISPTTAQREEYGTIVGTVRAVSNFPSTVAGMMAVVRNTELVRQFSSSGPPYRAIVALEEDPESASGYRWTSDRGKELDLHSGTLADAEVTVRFQRPIEMVIPLLREWTGL
jgi:HlyD family secretion protein